VDAVHANGWLMFRESFLRKEYNIVTNTHIFAAGDSHDKKR